MVGQRTGVILRQVQALLGAGTFSGLSDLQLLERFLERRDEVAELAFAVLVERHGPMVLGVCRRIAGDPHDADDAFQATFLVLARRAGSIRVEGSLGRWLFGVATRVATRARSDDRRRRLRERSRSDRLEAGRPDANLDAIDRAEIQAMIAREIAGLPARFQAPVLLCDLEGASCEEAARRLGWPIGTVKSRLSRARARLRDRLTRRGLTPSDLSIVTALWRAAPAPSLVASTTRAAFFLISGSLTTAGIVPVAVATLTQGVLRTMIHTKLKLAAASLLLIATGSAALLGQVSPPGGSGNSPASPSRSPRVNGPPARGDEVDLEMLERAWIDAINRHDTTVVDRILADEFEGIDQAGETFKKPAAVRDPLIGSFVTDSFAELEQVTTRVFGETAVVTSRVKVRESAARGSMTHVYIRRGGRWQCIASHASWASGGVCPAVGPIGGRAASAVRESRTPSQLSAAMATNCLVCHTAKPADKMQTPVAPVALRPGRGAEDVLRVSIDQDGRIAIAGKAFAGDRNAMQERLRVARVLEGRTELVCAVAETSFPLVEIVAKAALAAGFQNIRVTPMGHDDTIEPPKKTGATGGPEPRP
jgi:RNA polymerase sigma factor (sigma-70 family)